MTRHLPVLASLRHLPVLASLRHLPVLASLPELNCTLLSAILSQQQRSKSSAHLQSAPEITER